MKYYIGDLIHSRYINSIILNVIDIDKIEPDYLNVIGRDINEEDFKIELITAMAIPIIWCKKYE